MHHIHQAPPPTILLKNTINVRLVIICMTAASVELSMAIVRIAKFLNLLCGLITLLFSRRPQQGAKLWTTTGTQVGSGHVASIALLSVAIMWQPPKRYRAAILVLPFLLALDLFFSSTKVLKQLTLIKTEADSYSAQETPNASTGLRLGYFPLALAVIEEHPLTGAGVGSWKSEHNRPQRTQNPSHEDIRGVGAPHQKYLQWGVQQRIPGVLLFCDLMLSVLNDTLRMEKPYAHATQSALLALGVACLFNSSLYDAMIGDFFCIAIGLLLALGLSKMPNELVAAPQHKPAT